MSVETDPFEPRLALRTRGLLHDFNRAGVLTAADVHVATRLARLGGEEDEAVILAAALAVRAPRLGHVHVDLRRIRETAAVESDEPIALADLPWPGPEDWLERVVASPLVAVEAGAEAEPAVRPLRLTGAWLYLDRYWAEERQVAADLLALAAAEPPDRGGPPDGGEPSGRAEPPDGGAPPEESEPSRAGVEDGLFGSSDGDRAQRLAATTALERRLTVIAGGPGTGKTTTVARVLGLMLAGAAGQGSRPPLIALAAPTGKAAARLEEAVHAGARTMPVSEAVRNQLLALEAATLHRLLGRRPGSHSRFRHDRQQRLPHDVVIVDETSMVPLSLMARLIEAVRPGARLILVGDPAQLASIEAGAVLGDIVGPVAETGAALGDTVGPVAEAGAAAGAGTVAGAGPDGLRRGIVVLDHVHRFRGAIAELAGHVRRGDSAEALELLGRGTGEVTWLPVDAAQESALPALETVRSTAVASAGAVLEAASAGDAEAALHALGGFRLLCAHRRGPYGVSTWSARVEAWLAGAHAGIALDERFYPGRPLLVTENDYELGLYNGDTGVIVSRADGRVSAAFERRGHVVEHLPARLGAVETVHAMTIHKSQGSQFESAAVILPGPDSRLLTRELLYTAITRARERLVIAGTEEALRIAIERPVARASGLRMRLWGPGA